MSEVDPPFSELLARARSGERGALDELVADLMPHLQAVVRLHCGPLLRRCESQSDLVQTCFGRLLQDLPQFRGGDIASFRAWMLQLVTRKLNDRRKYWQAERRAPERVAHGLTAIAERQLQQSYGAFLRPSEAAMDKELRARFEEAFDELSEAQQEVLSLAVFGGLGHAEIAERTGRKEAACRALLARARARLALLLAAGEEESL